MCSVSVGLTGFEDDPVPRGTEALLVMTEETLLETLDDEAGTDGTELLGLVDEDAGTVGTVFSNSSRVCARAKNGMLVL